MMTTIAKIISGGQTGVDRAALDVAIQLGIPHGGWCPRGRRSEDGCIPLCYDLTETTTDDYRERTRLNIQDAHGTLILTVGRASCGTPWRTGTRSGGSRWRRGGCVKSGTSQRRNGC